MSMIANIARKSKWASVVGRAPVGLGILALAVGSALIVWWPLISGQKVFWHDWAGIEYGAFQAAGESLRNFHGFPTWTSAYLSGFPFTRSLVGIFHPLPALLLTALDAITAYHWVLIANFVAAFLAAYVFGRALELSRLASVTLAFISTYTQWNVEWAKLSVYSNMYVLPPLLFLAVLRLRSVAAPWYALLGTGALTLGFVSGIPDTPIAMALAAGGFALFLDRRESRRLGSAAFGQRWRTTLWFLGIGGASVLLALVFLLPTASLLPLSFREGGLHIQEAGGSGFTIADLALLVFPHFPQLPHLPSQPWIYVGFGSLFLGTLGLVLRRTHPLGSFFSWLLGAFFVIGLRYSPLYWMLHYLPVLNTQRGSFKLLLTGFFALAVLAAIGLDGLVKASERLGAVRRTVTAWQWLSGLMLTSTLGGLLLLHTKLGQTPKNLFLRILWERRGEVKPLVHYEGVFSQFSQVLAERLAPTSYHFIVALAAVAALFAVLTALKTKILTQRAGAGLLAVLVAGNAMLIWRNYHIYVGRDLFLRRSDTVAFLDMIKPAQPFRIFSAPLESFSPTEFTPESYVTFLNSLIIPNANIFFGYDTIAGNENLLLRRPARMLAALGTTAAPFIGMTEHYHLSSSARVKLLEKYQPTLSMMNVQYLITTHEIGPGWKKLYQSGSGGRAAMVYENPGVLPRAFFPESVRVLPVNEVATLPLVLGNRDFLRQSLIECDRCPAHEGSAEATVELLRVESGHLRLRTKTAETRWLVVAESNLPYWAITLDGKTVKSELANYIYHGIEVPRGEHEIIFEFPGVWGQYRRAVQDFFADPFWRSRNARPRWPRGEYF